MRDQQIEMAVVDGRLVITAGVNLICHAVSYGAEVRCGFPIKIINNNVFIKELLNELKGGDEDGTNLIHEALDRAAIRAVENGANGAA